MMPRTTNELDNKECYAVKLLESSMGSAKVEKKIPAVHHDSSTSGVRLEKKFQLYMISGKCFHDFIIDFMSVGCTKIL